MKNNTHSDFTSSQILEAHERRIAELVSQRNALQDELAKLRKQEPMSPYEYSVVDVTMRIHGYLSGSGDPIPDAEFARLVYWLEWRTSVGWRSGLPGWATFDEAVRRLANSALGAALAHMVEPGPRQRCRPPLH